MTKGFNFVRSRKSKHGQRSAMSKSAWCDLNRICNVLKLHDMCHNPKCNCQKQINFTPGQFQITGCLIQSRLQKIFEGTQSAWKKFLKPAINATAPFIGMAVTAKTKNPKFGQATTDILKSISGGKILGLTDMHVHGLRLKFV